MQMSTTISERGGAGVIEVQWEVASFHGTHHFHYLVSNIVGFSNSCWTFSCSSGISIAFLTVVTFSLDSWCSLNVPLNLGNGHPHQVLCHIHARNTSWWPFCLLQQGMPRRYEGQRRRVITDQLVRTPPVGRALWVWALGWLGVFHISWLSMASPVSTQPHSSHPSRRMVTLLWVDQYLHVTRLEKQL